MAVQPLELAIDLIMSAACSITGIKPTLFGKIASGSPTDSATSVSFSTGIVASIERCDGSDDSSYNFCLSPPPEISSELAEAITKVETAANEGSICDRCLRGLSPLDFEMPQLSGDDLSMYFGTMKVRFSRVGGECLGYAPGCLTQPPNTDEEAIKASTARMDGCKALGDGYEHAYEPVPPAADIVYAPPSAAGPKPDVALPAALSAPLLKTAEGGDAEGIRSGGRSAIIWDPSQRVAYRLKGCGNFVDGSYGGKSLRFPYPGLPVVPMEKMNLNTFESDEEAVEVRGCAFPHTALRELYMAGRVGEALKGTGVPCALNPAAVWVYDIGEKEPLPKLKKACAVCRTLGERRLAAHVVPGIEALVLEHLLPFNADASMVPEDAEAAAGGGGGSAEAADPPLAAPKSASLALGLDRILQLLPPARRAATTAREYDVDEDGMVDRKYPCVPTTMALSGPVEKYGEVSNPCLQPTEDAKSLPALREAVPGALEVATEGGGAAASGAGAGDAEGESGTAAFARRWATARDLLEASIGGARAALSKLSAGPSTCSSGLVVLTLCYRLGYECGIVRQRMTAADISWGNYMDHILEPHNNCHPNNLAVLPPSRGSGFVQAVHARDEEGESTADQRAFAPNAADCSAMLAPLDLDMAFERAAFVLNSTREPDDPEFSASLRREAQELRKNLAGNNSSTGLMGVRQAGGGPEGEDEATAAARADYNAAMRVVLRDCYVSGYDDGIVGKTPVVPLVPVLAFAQRAMLEMALVLASGRVS